MGEGTEFEIGIWW